MNTIDTKIAQLKKQLADLDATKKQQEAELKAEIKRLEALKIELENAAKFTDWTPSKKSIIDVIEMAGKTQYLPFFKSLRYTTSISEIGYDDVNLAFGDGWAITSHYCHGGGEGDGSEHYVVLSVTQHGANQTLWMVPGYYESYNGGELELHSLYQVEPYQKMVTDYRKVK